MREFVFVDGWQLHCCGTPFRLGTTVRWDVEAVLNNEWLVGLLDANHSRQVSYHQSDHGMTGTPFHMVAEVLAIEALSYDLEPDPDPRIAVPGQVLRAIGGSGRLAVLDSADGRESEPADSCHSAFAGYIVEVDTITVEPDG
jgi:hypothetical protein